ncbi:GATA zinc finger domain-containing protein 14-like [Mercenaria mercenaria]|uniref:GATA zinc finger domain-containing protein 14-like n=1 Tax=Mercenaria mercenaria TaxID=6596 RepID=UPI00234F5F3F|nr:GATA zinc finger domain-containing protein 14-like [Mercenaria mercenaria]
MKTINLLAIIHVLSASSGVVYSMIKTGQITQKSHPMLTSLFNLADDIRKHQTTQTAKHKCDANSGDPTNRKGLTRDANSGNSTNRKGVAKSNPQQIKQDEIFVPVKNPVTDTPIDTSHNFDIGNMLFLNMGKGMTDPDVLHTVKTNTKSDMCSQCRQRRDAKCVAIHCRNDEISSVPSGKGPIHLKSQPAADTLPVFSGKVNVRNRLDKPGILQLKNVNSPPGQNVLGIFSLDRLSLNPRKTGKVTADPIWLLPDELFDTLRNLPLNRVPNKEGRIELVQESISKKMRPADKTKSAVAINSDPALNMHLREINVIGPIVNRRIMFPARNVGSTVPSVDQQTDKTIHWKEGLVDHVHNRPLEVPTNTLMQLVKNDELPLLPSARKTNNLGNSNILHEYNSVKFADTDTKNVKNNGTSRKPLNTDRHNNVNKSTSMSDVQTVSDKVPDVTNGQIPMNRLTLVVKNIGNTEQIAVHMGDGPIPTGMRLFETRGQYSISKQANVQPTAQDNQLLPEQSHQTMNHKHSPENIHKSMNHQSLSEHSNQTTNHQHSPENFHKSMNHQSLSEHSNQALNHQHSPQNFHKSMNHQSLSEHSNQALNHQHSPQNFHKSMNHQSLSEHSNQTMNHQHSPGNVHKSMNHQNLSEHSNQTMNHQHSPENFHKSMNHQSLSDHSNQTMNHKHSRENYHKSMKQQSLSEHSNHTTNHQHSPENLDKSMNNQNLSEHSNETMNHQHSPENFDKSMNHQSLSEYSNQTVNHQHSPEDFHKSRNHQSLSDHSNQTMNHKHSPENYHKSMNHQSLSEHSSPTMNHQHSPENFDKSKNHQSLSEHSSPTMNHQYSPDNFHRSMNHQSLSEQSNQTMNHQHSPENFDKSMNHQNLSEHSSPTMNHQHSPENFHKSMNHQGLSGHSSQTMNHQHSPEKDHKSMNHQSLSEHSNQTMNHQH